MSKDWSIDEFERLAARITQQIEAYKYSLLYSNVPLAPIFVFLLHLSLRNISPLMINMIKLSRRREPKPLLNVS